MRFLATILQTGKTTTGIPVPDAVVTALGGGKRAPVRVTIGSHTYRSSIAVMGGQAMISLSAANRAAAGLAAGDEVGVDVELDREPREVTVPEDFATALAGDAEAQRFFDGLSFSRKSRFVIAIEDAKTDETRQRRIAKAVADLREQKG